MTATIAETHPIRELLHHPAATTRRLDAVRALRLRRRDAGDLVLMRIDRMESDAAVVDFTSRLLAGLMRADNIDALREALPEALPWVTFLPDEDIGRLRGRRRRSVSR
ncbi:hypothetical protein AB0D10_29590 [Kitasatospora sp. NPDC048545]|uniref:hypothetical protein n=1 Tax=Kitasatospora sp. NPDC048545 TaxID=3157208 RepID=UPI003407621B